MALFLVAVNSCSFSELLHFISSLQRIEKFLLEEGKIIKQLQSKMTEILNDVMKTAQMQPVYNYISFLNNMGGFNIAKF